MNNNSIMVALSCFLFHLWQSFHKMSPVNYLFPNLQHTSYDSSSPSLLCEYSNTETTGFSSQSVDEQNLRLDARNLIDYVSPLEEEFPPV